MSKEARQRATERFYVESFLRMTNLPFEIQEGERSPRIPDFLLMSAEGTVGLEVTGLYKDEGAAGSLYLKRERTRQAFMNDLAIQYYNEGGKAASVNLPNRSWSGSNC